MRYCWGILFVICFYSGRSQTVLPTDSIGTQTLSENIYNTQLFGDSLSTSFCIVIKKEVKAHKHQYHSEHVVVLEGEGLMKLNGKSFSIKKGDLVFIPKNSVHSVRRISKEPLKVLSIQSPWFNGSDRVFVGEQ